MWSGRLVLRLSTSFSSTLPKVKPKQLVTLFASDGKIIGVKSMAEAEAMAKKMNMMLRRKQMAPSQQMKESPYTLFDPRAEFDKPISVTAGKKDQKSSGVRLKKKVTIGANINENDITTKAKQISKFLKANSEVQVVSYGHVTNEKLEQIYKKFEQLFHELRIVQKVLKPGSLKFTILPDPNKFTGIGIDDDSAGHENEPEAMEIDDKEVEELVKQKLEENKK